MSITIGKAKVNVGVHGCEGCGCTNSSGWTVARMISVVIDGRKPIEVPLYRCADCSLPQPPPPPPPPSPPQPEVMP